MVQNILMLKSERKIKLRKNAMFTKDKKCINVRLSFEIIESCCSITVLKFQRMIYQANITNSIKECLKYIK